MGYDYVEYRKKSTHYEGTTGVLTIDMLVTQVENQRGGAVEETKHAHTHKELCRGGKVSLEEGVI